MKPDGSLSKDESRELETRLERAGRKLVGHVPLRRPEAIVPTVRASRSATQDTTEGVGTLTTDALDASPGVDAHGRAERI